MKLGPILAVLLVVIGGALWWYFYSPAPQPSPEVITEGQNENTYATSTFSIRYPRGYSVNESYSHDIAPGRRSLGVAFMVPPLLTEGTNLSLDSYISVESIPELSSCHAAQYAYEQPVSSGAFIVDEGIEYSVATTSGAGAGNFYEETVYVRQDPGPCIAVRYFIHTTNISNFEPGTIREFNREALLQDFDMVRRSIERM